MIYLLECDIAPVELTGALVGLVVNQEARLDEVQRLLPQRGEPHNAFSLHLARALVVAAHIIYQHLQHSNQYTPCTHQLQM
jgi:hypothetical protein